MVSKKDVGASLVGKNIQAARLAKGLSQNQLAELVDMSADAIRALEQGKNKAPRDFAPFVTVLGWSEYDLRFGRGARVEVVSEAYPALEEFFATPIGKAVTDEEREELCRRQYLHGTPTVETYQHALTEIRSLERGRATAREKTKQSIPDGAMRRPRKSRA